MAGRYQGYTNGPKAPSKQSSNALAYPMPWLVVIDMSSCRKNTSAFMALASQCLWSVAREINAFA